MSQPKAQCVTCSRLHTELDPNRFFSVENAQEESTPTCDAFPDGIPNLIYTNDFDHRKPFEGDQDLQWESNGEDFPEYAFLDDDGEPEDAEEPEDADGGQP